MTGAQGSRSPPGLVVLSVSASWLCRSVVGSREWMFGGGGEAESVVRLEAELCEPHSVP